MVKPSISEPQSVDASTDFLPGAAILLIDGDPAAQPTQPVARFATLTEMLRWGMDNNLPQDIIYRANKSPELLSLISKMISFIYGKGLYYEVYESAPVGNTRPKYVEGFDQEVEDWITYNVPNNSLLETITDLVWFNHAFPEMIKNKKGNKIVQFNHNEAAFCRFQRQNDQGFSPIVYVNANWPASTYADQLTIPVPSLNPKDFNKLDTVFKSKDPKVIYPLNFHSPGNVLYKSSNWHSIFSSRWFDVSCLIPVLKHALMKFMMTIKYVIEVPQEFWVQMAKDKGQDWSKLNYGEKKALRKIINTEMNDFLTGAENAGKSFVSTFGWDVQRGIVIPGIKVTSLDDKLKDGAWIEDSQEASTHFIKGMDLTPSIVGATGGTGLGAGSGSDAQVQFNILNNSLEPKRDKCLEPYNFIAAYNGWTKRMPGFRWRIREYQLNTLDQNHSRTNELPSPNAKPNQ
jgi:hypothetical protein